MSRIFRYELEAHYDCLADCYCDASIEIAKDGDYVKYTDYMTLLREYREYQQEVENAT